MPGFAFAARLRHCSVVLLAAAALAAHAALPPGIAQGPSVEGITEYRLANGLRVVLFPDPSAATTSVNVTYLVGSRHERYGETGMAHLLEHMTFKGTAKPVNYRDEMGRRGMRFNGTTWYDRTNYFETFNASPADLEWALAMEADRMVNSRIDRKDLDTEMTVVRNEMERGENNPSRITLQRLLASAYDWHNYGKSTIGARSDVEGVDIDQLRAFYRTYYQPDNAVLVVAGQFEPEQTLAWIAQYFGAVPKPTRTLPRLYTEEPVQDGERVVTIRRVGDQQLLGIGYHTVPGAHPDYVAVDALAEIMTIAPAGPPVQGAGRDAQGERRQQLRRVAARSRLCRVLRAGAARRFHRRRARRRAGLAGGRRPRADHAGGGRAGEGAGAQDHRRGAGRSDALRHRPFRIDRRGRLAPLLPAARSRARADRGRRAAGGARLPQARQPRDRNVPARRETGSRTEGRGRRRRRDAEGLQGRSVRRGGRGVRGHAGQSRRPHAALHASERHEGRAAAQEDARAHREDRAADRPGRREVAVRHGAAGRADGRDAGTRHRKQVAAGDRGHARPPAREGQLRRHADPHVGDRGDRERRAPRHARAHRRDAARAVVPGRGVREAAARAGHGPGDVAQGSGIRRAAGGEAATATRIPRATSATRPRPTRRSRW